MSLRLIMNIHPLLFSTTHSPLFIQKRAVRVSPYLKPVPFFFTFFSLFLNLALQGCSLPPLEPPSSSSSLPSSPSSPSPSEPNLPLNPSNDLTASEILAQDWENYTPPPPSLRKLTQTQLRSSLYSLFGPSIQLPVFTGEDLKIKELKSVGASFATLSLREVETFESLMRSLSQSALEETESRQWVLKCPESINRDEIQSAEEIPESCIRPTLYAFSQQAWRRPLKEEEFTRILDFVSLAQEIDARPAFALRYGFALILQSPSFLFRTEHPVLSPSPSALPSDESDDSSSPSSSLPSALPLDPFDLATRLSFFLWNQPPDSQLIEAASNGSLLNDDGLQNQLDRLLVDSRFRDGLKAFFDEAFHLENLKYLNKDPTLFEHYYVELGLDARQETLRFLEFMALGENQDFREILTSPVSFINSRLAALYAVPSSQADDFSLMVYPEHHKRVGLLGQVSFLAQHSHVTSSSATLRGAAIRTLFLCQSIPSPPVEVDTAIPEPSGNTITLRQRVAEHLENPSCSGCHQLMDPIGLGLEGFDSIGRWRSNDSGVELDLSGQLDGVEFTHPVELAHTLFKHPDFSKCMVKHLTRYALGRLESSAEDALIEQLNTRFKAHQYRFKSLIQDLVLSPLFRQVAPLSPHLIDEDSDDSEMINQERP